MTDLEKDIERVLRKHVEIARVKLGFPLTDNQQIDAALISDLAALLQERGELDRRELEKFLPNMMEDWVEASIGKDKLAIFDKITLRLMAWASTGKPQRKVSREQLQKILDGYAEDCFRGNLGVEKALDALMALLGEPAEPKWCGHMERASQGQWYLAITGGSNCYAGSDWTCCPICKAERPKESCQHIWIGSALGATGCSKCGAARPRPATEEAR